MRYTLVPFTVTLAIIIGVGPAAIGQPLDIPKADQLARVGVPYQGCVMVVDADTTSYHCYADSNRTDIAWYAWGTSLTVQSDVRATCCLTMTSTVTLGAQTGFNANYLTDGGDASKNGYCRTISLVAGGQRQVMVEQSSVTAGPGNRTGVCNKPGDVSVDGKNVFPPCRVDGDCTDSGMSGATCTTSPTNSAKAASGALLKCRAAAAGFIFVNPER